jgi:hypothetical protein
LPARDALGAARPSDRMEPPFLPVLHLMSPVIFGRPPTPPHRTETQTSPAMPKHDGEMISGRKLALSTRRITLAYRVTSRLNSPWVNFRKFLCQFTQAAGRRLRPLLRVSTPHDLTNTSARYQAAGALPSTGFLSTFANAEPKAGSSLVGQHSCDRGLYARPGAGAAGLIALQLLETYLVIALLAWQHLSVHCARCGQTGW